MPWQVDYSYYTNQLIYGGDTQTFLGNDVLPTFLTDETLPLTMSPQDFVIDTIFPVQATTLSDDEYTVEYPHTYYVSPTTPAEEAVVFLKAKELETKKTSGLKLTRDEEWIMKLGLVSNWEKESAFEIKNHHRIMFGNVRKTVLTYITNTADETYELDSWEIQVMSEEIKKDKYSRAYAARKRYVRKLAAEGKRI